jgi:hypothetical protein
VKSSSTSSIHTDSDLSDEAARALDLDKVEDDDRVFVLRIGKNKKSSVMLHNVKKVNYFKEMYTH